MLTNNILTKEKIVNVLNAAIEFFVYVVIIGITFSNAAVEVGIGVSIFFWLIKKIITQEFSFLRIDIKKFLLIFIIFNLFTTLYNLCLYNGLYLENSLKGLFRPIKYLFFLAVVISIASERKSLNRLIFVFILASVVICFDGLFQYFNGADLFRHRALTRNDVFRRISAAFCHPNDFAAYLITVIPLYMGLIYYHKKTLIKSLLFVALGLLLFCLYKTSSRGAWLGFMISVLTFICLKKDKKLFIIVPLFFIFSLLIIPQKTIARIKESFNINEGTGWERKQIWTGAINIFKEHPLIGFGPNTFSATFPKYKPKIYPDNRYAHNSYLQIAAEIGILGLTIFLIILFLIIKSAVNFFKKAEARQLSEANIILGIFCGLIGFLIHSGLDTNFSSLVLTTLFWTITGMIYGFNKAYVEKKL